MMVDASAIVAILTREPEADRLADCLDEAERAVTSPLAIFEATLGLCRKRFSDVEDARNDVQSFLDLAGITTIPLTADDADRALRAFSRYGKGRGHPAQLNMGDCFAYAAAQSQNLALLFVGDDFSRTDIAIAFPIVK